jgi:glycosyltransferase involved in cell wall biosynthesis
MRTQESAPKKSDASEAVAITHAPGRLRVLLIHERFAPDFGGGGERVVLAIARHLMDAGVALQVLTTGDPAIAEYDRIPTLRLPVSRYRLNLALPTILRLAKSADVIQTFNYHACLPSLLAGKISHKPVVCMFLGLIQQSWLEMRGPILGRAFRYWENFLVNRDFSRVLFLTDDNRETAVRLRNGPERLLVNHPGISTSEFSPAENKENMVVFVGKYDVRKGVHDVLEVARALPQVPFVMIGWGALEKELKSEAPQNVQFYPIEDRDALRRSLARAACFFLPSQGEGFPVALLEAMASGCAVVSTVPVNFAGVRVAPGDRSAMIAGIKRLWQEPGEMIRLGKINAELASKFSWEAHASRLINVYREVLSEREG